MMDTTHKWRPLFAFNIEYLFKLKYCKDSSTQIGRVGGCIAKYLIYIFNALGVNYNTFLESEEFLSSL